jgi:flavin reductase (DIM6/NTAB) family NADH-FMN oxidoreductase RutF/rubredoxin
MPADGRQEKTIDGQHLDNCRYTGQRSSGRRTGMDNQAMFKLTYGLFVLTAKGDGIHCGDNGCIINTAGQVTVDPNQISICVNKTDFTHDLILKDGKFNISVLSEKAKFDTFKRFGFQSGRDVDKFADYAGHYERSANGLLYVTESTNAYISGDVVKTIDLGTHTMFIARVTDLETLDDAPSTTYTYYQSNIKPKPQTAAPAAGKKTKTVWRCRVCGYIYDGPELPPDFVCPVCKHGAADFEKIEVEA